MLTLSIKFSRFHWSIYKLPIKCNNFQWLVHVPTVKYNSFHTNCGSFEWLVHNSKKPVYIQYIMHEW